MRFLPFLLTFPALFAQTTPPIQLSFSSGSSVKKGFSGSRDIIITSQLGQLPAGLQFTLTWSTQFDAIALSAAAASTSANKTLTCNNPTTNSISCIIEGINQTLIPNGAIVTINFSVPKNAPSSVTFDIPATVPLMPLGVTLIANPISATGGSVSIPFVNLEDLNGDGITDVNDVNISIQQVLGNAPCGNADLNGDGKCNLLDVQLIIKSILGL